MHEQPLHRSVWVAVSRRQKRLLAADGRESHDFELRHSLCVELGKSGCFLCLWKFGLSWPEAMASVFVKLENVISG